MSKKNFKSQASKAALSTVRGVFGTMYLAHTYVGEAVLNTESFLVHKLDKNQEREKIVLDRLMKTKQTKQEIQKSIDAAIKQIQSFEMDFSTSPE